MRHGEVQKYLYEYVRGELEVSQAQQVEAHLARCNKCYGEMQIVKESIRLVPSRTGKPSDERSDTFWAQFVESVDQKTQSQKAPPVLVNLIWDEIWATVTLRRPLVLGVVGIVTAAAIALVLWTASPGTHGEDQAPQFVGGVKADSLRLELANYFRTSKILLVGISNIDMERGEHLDFTEERQVARKLIRQARSLDNRVDDERSHQLIQALERILLELANMEQKADLPDLEIVRSGIHQENMLFKIRMAESEFSLADNPSIR